MLTGDNWTTAKAVARRLGIDEVEAEVLPEQKSEIVTRLKSQGRVVAMAGGIHFSKCAQNPRENKTVSVKNSAL